MSSTPEQAPTVVDDTSVTRQQWKWSALAGMASYLDAGSIVALGAGLALCQEYLNVSNGAVGTLAAIGPNALGCAVGAIFGGWLGDKLGRKFIYQYDLMVYAVGILFIALAVNTSMLFVGTLIVGIAVGIDAPTSLALVGELAPAKARGKLLGFTQVAWCLRPVIVLWLAVVLAPLGWLGIRIIFLHLFVVAVVTWAMRRGLTESVRWKAASQAAGSAGNKIMLLFSGANLRAMIWTATIYLFWNLAAGTAGIFNPYFIKKLNAGSQAASVGLASAGFIIAMVVTVTVFMRFSDRSFRARKTLWGIGAVMQIVAYSLFLFLPFTIPTIIMNILLFSAGGALAGEGFYKRYSARSFFRLYCAARRKGSPSVSRGPFSASGVSLCRCWRVQVSERWLVC
ncbi:MAG: MFS transporter [Candidatus Synoicihabitans palmerolidicus]|nr:MFS transporter [Candidatus Synoicihabitans palmerolidicus]MCC5025757.1 MFS transporter [Candidatus Synoicihabitans palmerolidicus]